MNARPLPVAMLCAAAVMAEFVGGKATRDALFLTSLSVQALPGMLIVTAVFSMLLVVLYARAMGRLSPATVVPTSFALSGLLFVFEWVVRAAAPSATAVVVYLHVSAAGPLLASGFWLIAGDRFDPRTAKARFGQIGGAGTLGGLFGAVVAERVAVYLGAPAMLLVLGALQFLAAWLVWTLAGTRNVPVRPASDDPRQPLLARLSMIAGAPHLRDLMALVVLGTTSAALLDYVFKTRAAETLGSGDGLLRFFALFYGATSLVSLALQTFGNSSAPRRSGIGLAASSPSIALIAGGLASLMAPGFGSLVVARASESIFRASWFRAGYERFFTPMQAEEKRTAKPFIDVALDRLGDAVAGGIVRLVIVAVPLAHSTVILALALLCAIGAIVAASHLNRWYVRSLERSLVNQRASIEWPDTIDHPTMRFTARLAGKPGPDDGAAVADILVLRRGNREHINALLSRPEGLAGYLVPHVIPLLGWDAVADRAMFALRKVAEEHAGALIDALLDPNTDATIRRRLARIFSICVSQRAADGLLVALDDTRFDVRFQVARSLLAIVDKNPRVRIDRARIEDVVLQEVAVSRPMWEGRRLLAGLVTKSPLDAFIKDRGGQSLAHVFTLLSLVLPREPLQIAFRGLSSDDQRLRGTAVEYLEQILPARIRQGLWPFIAPEHGLRVLRTADAF